MRSPFTFDHTQQDYGPSTPTIRQLMSEWCEVEWITPPLMPRPIAHQLFSEHHRLARPYLPARLAEHVDLVPATGGWAEFAALCKKVRSQTTWDWKYSVLKEISREHSRARGWSTAEKLRQLRDAPDLGNLYRPMGDGICYFLQWHWPRFEQVAGAHAESGSFYYEYCTMDFVDSIEWQLAEPSAPLAHNPFYLLLRGYAAGYYPFSLGPESVVMFAFTQSG